MYLLFISKYCPPKVIDNTLETSGFLFINNIFYNDTRKVSNTDYSKPILNWLKEKQMISDKIPIEIDFQADSMDKTTFKSLKLSLGERYLYYHNKKCEHIIIFTDIRSYNKVSDKKYIESYPDITFLSYNPINKSGEDICRMCNICDYLPAKHVTVGDKYSGEYVCYFCDNCYKSLHYDENGDLLYDDFDYYSL